MYEEIQSPQTALNYLEGIESLNSSLFSIEEQETVELKNSQEKGSSISLSTLPINQNLDLQSPQISEIHHPEFDPLIGKKAELKNLQQENRWGGLWRHLKISPKNVMIMASMTFFLLCLSFNSFDEKAQSSL